MSPCSLICTSHMVRVRPAAVTDFWLHDTALQAVLDSLAQNFNQKTTEERLGQAVLDSFNAMSPIAKNMLLDAVSVLYGQAARLAQAYWAARWEGEIGSPFAELQQRALVSVDNNGKLLVTDAIRMLGQDILCNPHSSFYGTRAWIRNGQLAGFVKVRKKASSQQTYLI